MLGTSLGLAGCTSARPNSSAFDPLSAHGPAFTAALGEWCLEAGVVGGADQGVPLAAAVSDLQIGEDVSLSDHNTTEYSQAIRSLQGLENTPDSMPTLSEQMTWNVDQTFLDDFFHTPDYISTRQSCGFPAA